MIALATKLLFPFIRFVVDSSTNTRCVRLLLIHQEQAHNRQQSHFQTCQDPQAEGRVWAIEKIKLQSKRLLFCPQLTPAFTEPHARNLHTKYFVRTSCFRVLDI